jgi:hypothetical protein
MSGDVTIPSEYITRLFQRLSAIEIKLQELIDKDLPVMLECPSCKHATKSVIPMLTDDLYIPCQHCHEHMRVGLTAFVGEESDP